VSAERPAPLIAIDGPAGAGKSTVSRAVAKRLGLDRLDTGAMYRSVAWEALRQGVNPADEDAVAAIAAAAEIEVGPVVRMNGHDVTEAIRSEEVSRAVSIVAANPGVRRELVTRQRRWAAERSGGVVEGRDIGSVVFPKATVKIFLTASPDERARRRGGDESPDGVARRDRLDSTRVASPLTRAPDAHLLDTTGRSVEDVVQEVLSWL
jgi:cytidylate kinase